MGAEYTQLHIQCESEYTSFREPVGVGDNNAGVSDEPTEGVSTRSEVLVLEDKCEYNYFLIIYNLDRYTSGSRERGKGFKPSQNLLGS